MPKMRTHIRGGSRAAGGVLGYPLNALYEEVAYLGYYLHWGHDTVIDMEHADRRRWCEEVAKINRKLNESA